jgi:hypothetical protein
MGTTKSKNPSPTPVTTATFKLPQSKAGTYVSYIFYVLIILFGVILVVKPEELAPVLIQIAGGLLILLGLVESIVTYLNRR